MPDICRDSRTVGSRPNGSHGLILLGTFSRGLLLFLHALSRETSGNMVKNAFSRSPLLFGAFPTWPPPLFKRCQGGLQNSLGVYQRVTDSPRVFRHIAACLSLHFLYISLEARRLFLLRIKYQRCKIN
jgi:hypothetical protein